MSIEIKVPAMGESVTEATVARWFKKKAMPSPATSRFWSLKPTRSPWKSLRQPMAPSRRLRCRRVPQYSRCHPGRHRRRRGGPSRPGDLVQSQCGRRQTGRAAGRSVEDAGNAAAGAGLGARKPAAAVMPAAKRLAEEGGVAAEDLSAPARTAVSPRAMCWPSWNRAPVNALRRLCRLLPVRVRVPPRRNA